MSLDFRNRNTLWASVLAQTLQRLGLRTAVICPGSRSAPLAIAFARLERVEAIPVLDERSAAFFALGIARRTHWPVVLICTSGTAGANFYPAVIEAHESHVPLLVLTADRPPELRHCHAGQAIDQQKLFGSFPNWYSELALPSVELKMLAYVRQTAVHAWERSRLPTPGPVHLNCPFREPLAPTPQPEVQALAATLAADPFLTAVQPQAQRYTLEPPVDFWQGQLGQEGLMIAGPSQPERPEAYCQAVAHLSQDLGWPVLADGLSPLRNYAELNPHLISTYDLILRNSEFAKQLAPTQVIRLGELPTSKTLRTWLAAIGPQQWVVDPAPENFDPLHGPVTHLRSSVEALAQARLQAGRSFAQPPRSRYLERWRTAESKVRHAVDQSLASLDERFEGKIAWVLSQTLPPDTPLFIANSTPVRDLEAFWQPGNRHISPLFNRGASGIDGTLSTALGMAHRQPSSVMLTGDLALLHDTNGFLLKNQWLGHLTIVLINNNGGGIFETLPIAEFEPPFEKFFATPQNLDFAQLCRTYGVEHRLIQSWQQLEQALNPLPAAGIRVLEIPTQRKADAEWRRTNLEKFAASLC